MSAIADVVLEQTRGTIVSETLCQLDNGDEKGGSGQVLANTAQSPPLIVTGLLAVRSGTRLSTIGRESGEVLLLISGNEAAGEIVNLVAVVSTLVELLVEPGWVGYVSIWRSA